MPDWLNAYAAAGSFFNDFTIILFSFFLSLITLLAANPFAAVALDDGRKYQLADIQTRYDALLPKLERGALIVCDNLLWKGRVAANDHDAPADALRAFNKRIATDSRLITSILPLGDGTGVSVVI